VLDRDVALGLDTGFLLVNLLVALVAGLLFGNLLIPARRNL
jgi:nucleoside permease NupC